MTTLLDDQQMDEILDRLAQELSVNHNGNSSLALIGIRTGGAFLAQRLKDRLDSILKTNVPLGIIDINLYRDDWTRASIRPRVGQTKISFSIDDKDVVLVDDVLYTGRTVRAAMDLLVDFGRPRRIQLLVLVDRGHRELPICANFIGFTYQTSRDDLIDVRLQETGAKDEVTLVHAKGTK